MPKPKLAAKNLEVLSELMLIEELAYKKCDLYSRSFKDDALQTQCKDLAQNHKARFNALHDYLNSHN
ncbi:hypothetical protein FACS1894211_10830 [Clostridia bacterium]|nr:hypothetical protein FACS1894211_10830 [Clostridia bacterium]